MIKKTTLQMIILGVIFAILLPLGGASAQEDAMLYSQNFESGRLDDWEVDPGWKIAESESGVVLASQGHVWASYNGGSWSDYRLRFRVRLAGDATLHTNFRTAEGPSRYFFGLSQDGLYLVKQTGPDSFSESLANASGLGDGWQTIEISGDGPTLTLSVNDQIVMTYADPEPLLSGGISFESLTESQVQIDDIEIWGAAPGEVQIDDGEQSAQPSSAADSDLPALPWYYTGGPSGGLGYDIRMDPRNPDVMYVTDALAGAFKSIDGGATWFPINNGITSRVGTSLDAIPVFSLTVDPNNPDTLWVGTQFSSGVFRSDNGGESWEQLSNGIQERSLTIRGFTVEPQNSDVVYLAGEVSSWDWNDFPINGIGFDLTKGVIYKTSDGGKNWLRIWYGDHLARYVWIHPEDHNRLYVSTGIFDREAANSNPDSLDPGGVGILRSDDGGRTWKILGVEHGIRADELYLGSLSMHPQDPDILIAASANDAYLWALPNNIGAIYRTQNGGDSWERVLDLPNASAVEICESDPDVVYAASVSGFYRSDDGGTVWEQQGGSGGTEQTGTALWGPPDVAGGFPIDMQCDPRDSMRIFVNNYVGGNFLSEDGGQNWINASKGYTGAAMQQIVVDESNPAIVYASARSGIFKSTDGGENWQGLARGVARALECHAIAVNPVDSNHVIITLLDAGPVPKLSYDGGQTWREANPESGSFSFFEWGAMMKMSFSPTLPDRVIGIEGDRECDLKGTCNNGHGVIFSSDGGKTWSQSSLREGMVTDLAFAADGSVYAAVYPGDLYHSTDNGENWELLVENISHAIVSQAADPDMMPDRALMALAVDPGDSSKLYAGFMLGGVMISEDSGATWRISSSGMVPESSIIDLAVDSTHPGVIYAGSDNSGVYLSINGGEIWTAINGGLLNRAGVSMALSTDGSVLYLATNGGGVFRLGTPVSVPIQTQPEPEQTSAPTTIVPGIQIDGSTNDWANKSVLEDDPIGDNEAEFLDLTTGYAYLTEDALYFAINAENPDMPFSNFDIQIQVDEKELQIIWTPGDPAGLIGDITSGWKELGTTRKSEFAFDSAFEGRIDFADLGSPSEIKLHDINVMVGECCEYPAWRAADNWHTDKDTPGDHESIIETELSPGESTKKPSSNIPCIGGLAPIAMIGFVWVYRRRR